jgi:hypothetical protein
VCSKVQARDVSASFYASHHELAHTLSETYA